MQKLFKIFLITIIPIIIILLVTLFINIIIIDWKYAHKSLYTHQDPFNWVQYKSEINLLKFLRSRNDNNKKGLKEINLYIDQKFQKELLINTPKSTKNWQEAFYLLDNNKLKKIMIRHRGDNPKNWLLEKKHWRIKTRKKDQFERNRFYDFFPFNLEKYISGKVASQIGLITPKYNLIELFINEKSSGIYIESEYINENFLRRNKFMPVNIYKGEQILTESIIGTTGDLFNNTSTWTKASTFNKLKKNDKSDLEFFLNLLNNSEIDKYSYHKLIDKIDINQWSKFSAYQILTQNYHNDYGHNMRLIIDSWSGKILPIVHDPIIGLNNADKIDIDLEFSSHGLLRFLNKNSFFIHEKYEKLYNYLTKNKIIRNQLKSLNKIEEKIIISEKRDLEIQRKFFKNIKFTEILSLNKKITQETSNERTVLANNLINHESSLIKIFNSDPLASWTLKGKNININIDGYLPLSNIEIFFDDIYPKWLSFDFNSNNIIENDEKFFVNKQGKVTIPMTLYANRLSSAKNLSHLLEPEIIIANTNYTFTLDIEAIPTKITSTNPFTLKNSKLDNKKRFSVPANKFNQPILNKKPEVNFTKISGNIFVENDMVFNDSIVIAPGTRFKLSEGKSVIFRNKVHALGSKDLPIIFESSTSNKDKIWGTIAVQGMGSKGSILDNIIFDGGSGAIIDQIHYTSMLSLHDTKDIKLSNIVLKNNHIYDDSLHLVYCDNIELNKIVINNAIGDALDIDISKNIIIRNSRFINSTNDGIDLMESEVLIDASIIIGAGDKGVSVGENSNLLIYNSRINGNEIGIAVKDKSFVKVIYTTFDSNSSQINAYQKNLQYGDGGSIEIYKSFFKSFDNKFSADKKSNILIDDTSFNKVINFDNKRINLSENNNYNGKKNTHEHLNILIKHPLFSKISISNNKKIRGSTSLIN